MSVASTVCSCSMVSVMKSVSRPQKPPPMATSGKRCSLPVCIRVTTSNASSRVPKPPGITTKAEEYFTSITLRTKKCWNSMKRST